MNIIALQDLHQKLQEGEETDRKIKEKQLDLCKIKLYCNHPKLNTVTESKIYCCNDTPLKQVTELAYKVSRTVFRFGINNIFQQTLQVFAKIFGYSIVHNFICYLLITDKYNTL